MDETRAKELKKLRRVAETRSRELESHYQAGVAFGLQLANEMGEWDPNLMQQPLADRLADWERDYKAGKVTAKELKNVRIQHDCFRILRAVFQSLGPGESKEDFDFVLQLWSFLAREPMEDRPALKARCCRAIDEEDFAWLDAFAKTLDGGVAYPALVTQALGVSIVRWDFACTDNDYPSKKEIKAVCIVRFPNIYPASHSRQWTKILGLAGAG